VLSYFKQFYGDTAVNGYKPALESGYEFFGAEHIMFATDAPFVPVGPQLAAIQDWDVQVKQKEQILGTNARRFYNV
jgi:aminocarboxymuconate-semialdehyde decarboxylase